MRKSLHRILLLLAVAATHIVYGSGAAPSLSVHLDRVSLQSAISQIEKTSDYSFFYDANSIDLDKVVSLNCNDASIEQAMSKMLDPIGQEFDINGMQILLLIESDETASGATSRTISGTIIDKQNQTIIGAAVVLAEDSMRGTTTDLDGKFSIVAPAGAARLIVSCVGYETTEVAVAPNKDNVSITLEESLVAIDEMVVIGYGTQKKVNLTGAIATVGEENLKNRSAASVDKMLQGAVPGLSVTTGSGQPGKASSLNIRGVTSINGGSPLILVDGAEGDLSTLNPNDVASISVIKDASAAAIYGARAAFGVILVTTKSGNTDNKTKVVYSGRYGWTAPTTSTDYETRGYYSVYLNDLFYKSYAGVNYSRYTMKDYDELWARRYDTVEDPSRPWVTIDQRNGKDTYVYYGNTDWYHELFQDEKPVQSHSVSLSGGNKQVQYLLSGGYYTEEGVFKTNSDQYSRYNLRSKVTFKVNDWIKASNNSSLYTSAYTFPGMSNISSSFASATVHGLASYVPHNPDDTSVYQTSFSNYGIMDGLTTMLDNENWYNKQTQTSLANTTEFTLTPIEGLSIVGNFTYKMDLKRYTNRSLNTQYSMSPYETETLTSGAFEDKLKEQSNTHNYYQTNIFATYDKSFNESHNIKVMAGYNWETKHLKDITATGYNLLSESLNDLSLVGQDAEGEVQTEVDGGQNEYALMGFFARFNYDYKGRYLAELSGRYDGTSRFASGARWALFPSLSVGWRVSEEPFFASVKPVIDNLKLRYSYGSLGNQNVGYYDYIQTISTGTQGYLFGGGEPTSASISAPVASDLTWEISVHNNVGVDLSTLDNRLNFSADFYIRDTKNMLTDGIALPGVYGDSAPQMNCADLRTKGYELSLNWRDQFDLLGSPFEYSVNLSFNDYTTTITKFDNPDRLFAKKYYEGMQWGEMWGYSIGGLFASDEAAAAYGVDQTSVNSIINSSAGDEKGVRAGDMIFKDLDGDNVISLGDGSVDDPGDRRIIGNSEPRFMYGANISMSWYGVDFSAFFQGVGRQDWYPGANCLPFWGPYARPYATFIPKDFHTLIWSADNPDSYFPRPRGYIAMNNTNRSLGVVNDRYIQNIGYCRLKNLTVGYTLPSSWTKKISMESLRVYFSGENLLTWSGIESDYIDPEMAATGGTLRIYPWQSSYMFGVDVTF